MDQGRRFASTSNAFARHSAKPIPASLRRTTRDVGAAAARTDRRAAQTCRSFAEGPAGESLARRLSRIDVS